MSMTLINGVDYANMLSAGCKALASDCERINALNVFPVPDGDTGTNMKMTVEGGAKEGLKLHDEEIGSASSKIARAMVLSARGNSGVITSQFFKGISLGLEGKKSVDTKELAEALVSGYKKAYSVVSNPTEGTILTVMREASDKALTEINDDTSLIEYFEAYLGYAYESLKKTPELLPVLKEAGVIDSGGAGFCLIIDGMLRYLKGEEVEGASFDFSAGIDVSTFNKDSELTYGYCTEFILQLQTCKVDPDTFDISIINQFLESIGNSIVSFKDDDIVKVHVHTFDPGVVLTKMREYGEFLTIKIENMNVSHTEGELAPVQPKEHKKYATVAVASGDGIVRAFKEMGVDIVVSGGQTMNTSIEDFTKAFDQLNADNIIVYPNNSNILMAAKVASTQYTKANVYVVETKTIAEGYSAAGMLNTSLPSIDEILEEERQAVANIKTLEVTYSVRDTELNGVMIKKGDYIAIYDHNIICANPDRAMCVKEAFSKIEDFDYFEVMTVIAGNDVDMSEVEEVCAYASDLNSFIEAYPVEGEQDIYSYIIGLE